MLYKLSMIVCLLLFIHTGKAQPTAFDIIQYVDQLPGVAADIDKAHQQYVTMGKNSIYKKYEATLQTQINILADQSQHKSRLLSMLAGRYDEEGERYDFSKAVFDKDAELTEKQHEATRAFMREVDDFMRATGLLVDSIRNTQATADVKAKNTLRMYQQAFPGLLKKVKQLIAGMNDVMNKKGYNVVLNNRQQTHKYYIQLLEVRGLMLERIKQLIRVPEAVSQLAGSMKE